MARRISSGIAWLQLKAHGAKCQPAIHPSTDGDPISSTVFAAEYHLTPVEAFGFMTLRPRERLICQFHGAASLQRIRATRRGRAERGDQTRLKVRREVLAKRRAALRRSGVGGWKDEVREDARLAARRGTQEAVEAILHRRER